MKAVCQCCGKVVHISEATGWLLDHWLGYRFTESEVKKVGLCSDCLHRCANRAVVE